MADYNVDTLENKVVVEADKALKGLDALIGKAEKIKNSINSLKTVTGLKNIKTEANKATSSLTKMGVATKTINKIFGVTGALYGLKRLSSFLQESTKNSVNLSETMNLFEVSMGKTLNKYGELDDASSKYYSKALKFQNQLNEKFGTNIEETMKYQALYNQMAKSMGIGNEPAYTISENLTKLGIDLASLFNKDESSTMESLRAGVLAGQTKPLRNYGLDVTQQTLAPLLKEIGITRSVKQLSQAEKMILRYIAVLKQASSAHGDFAKTIESPSNQLKVFKQQFEELKTTVGNLFQNLLGNVLPYANATIMVIKELFKALGSVFGFSISSNSTNLASTVGIDDLEDGLNSASDSAKKLKSQLLGFDEIHNITENQDSSGIGVNSNGIDNKLIEAMSEYDNLMGNIEMKATKIRDGIMDWLGFTKVINPLTGEISFELKKGWTNLKKIGVIAGTLLGLGITAKTISLIGQFSKLVSVLKGTKTATSNFGLGLQALKRAFTTTTPGVGKHAEEVTKLNTKAIKATAGIIGLTASIYASYNAMKDLSTGTKKAEDAYTQLGIAIGGGITSGALLGSTLGKEGAVVGAIVGGAAAGISALLGYKDEFDKLDEAAKTSAQNQKDYYDEIDKQRQTIQDNMNADLGVVDYTQQLVGELDNLVDANGRVKTGYEDRVSFILNQLNQAYDTEYSLVNGQIQNYKDLKDSIYDIIEAKKAEIILNANEQNYSDALKRINQLQQIKIDNQNNLNDATNKYNSKLQEIIKKYGSLEKAQSTAASPFASSWGAANALDDLKKLEDSVNTYKNALNETNSEIEIDNKTIIYWEDAKTATINGNADEIAKTTQKLTTIYEGATSDQGQQLQLQIEAELDYAKAYKQINKDLTDEDKKQLDTRLTNLADNLVEQTNTIGLNSADYISAWKSLANGSTDVYNEALSKLDPYTALTISATLGTIDTSSPEVIDKFKKLATDSTDKYNEVLELLPQDTRNKVDSVVQELINGQSKASQQSYAIKDIITKNLSGDFKIDFGLNIDFTQMKKDLEKAKLNLTKLSNTPFVGNMFNKQINSVDDLLNKLSIQGYESGGMPETGEMFIANEAGPELVGRIGNRTAVANQGQIIEGIKQGVYSAVVQANSSNSKGKMTIKGTLEGKNLLNIVIDGVNGITQQTGECPIEVL